MKKTTRCLFYLPLLALLGACAGTDTVAPTNPLVMERLNAIDRSQKAVMVVYRAENPAGRRPTVMLDGKDLVNMGHGEVFVAGINPGSYVFEMDNKESGTQVTLKPGDEVFMRIDIVAGAWSVSGRLTQVAPQQGNYEATRLQLIEPKEIEMPNFR